MFNPLIRKTGILLFLLFVGVICNARQVHTVSDGDWFSPSVWYNQVLPNSTYDTIEIANHITANAYVVLAESDIMTIDSGASLCGADTFEMYDDAKIYVQGYLGANSIWVGSLTNYFFVGANGTVATSGEWGFGFAGQGAIQLSDSLGGCITYNASGGQCNLDCAYDSSIFTYYNGSIVTFEVDTFAVPNYYRYFFGDGDSSGITTYYQVHAYTDTGYYNVMVLFEPCCNIDTLRTVVHITSLITGLMPVSWCNITEPFIKSAVPAVDELFLGHTFCSDMHGTIKLYSLTGAQVYAALFNTVGNVLKQIIPISNLAPSCYILSIETDEGSFRQRVIIGR